MSKITWTKTDEAPALATYSLLPTIKAFVKNANIEVELKDISLSARVLAAFSKANDDLAYLGKMVNEPEANIIKLPNISASLPQLKACIKELQEKGYDLPDFPEEVKNEEQKIIKEKYSTVLGSAVNPVLRQGNSDRRAALAVKNYAKANPHKLKDFEKNSKACVKYMQDGDFYANEKSVIINKNSKIKIQLNGKLLKEIEAQNKEILDATLISAKKLNDFYEQSLNYAKENNLLWSVHLKATMMKVSDPVLFGYAVKTFFKEVFETYENEFNQIGVNANLGLADLFKKIQKLPKQKEEEIKKAIEKCYENRPNLAMVNSDLGITNLHFPNDIIIDASMPVVLRDGGKMWNKNGDLQECVASIPDRTYATMYEEILQDCQKKGKFDVRTMGSVSNIGLMAQKAEEYGSHPTTFEITENGELTVSDENGTILSHNVEKGDIWRMSRLKDEPVKDWVRLAVLRAKLTNTPAIFWLDENRAHDTNVIKKVKEYLALHDTSSLDIQIKSPKEAMAYSLKRIRNGQDTISVTGNVLRDYLTDLFPILELGTSAKMLSIVPLLKGGGLFETGAGGSAPKHVEQFIKEGHLRWDSLGEFLALAESLRFISQQEKNESLEAILETLDKANQAYLDNNKTPSRKAKEIDNKATHFYLAFYWAKYLATQDKCKVLKDKFTPIFQEFQDKEKEILQELLSVEGKSVDLGGYYKLDDNLAEHYMRPSKTLNSIIAKIG